MESRPFFSIVIPVYNTEQYVDQAIQSWVDQTFRNIEIICIDDASTDSSLDRLRSWAEKDERIRVFHFDENKSPWSARKRGIEEANGQYIMFGDADDTIVPVACEELHKELLSSPVDILHFGADVINCCGLPEKRIRSKIEKLRPYEGRLEGKEILPACFLHGEYAYELWSKVIRADLCKRVFADQKDEFFQRAEDKLAYFLLAYYAGSYRGIVGKIYYHYYYGRGSTGNPDMTVPQFESFCSMAHVAAKLKEFLMEQNVYDQYAEIERIFRRQMLAECVYRWADSVQDTIKGLCFDRMFSYWDPAEVIGEIARLKWNDRYRTAKWLMDAQSLRFRKTGVKTIATYYSTMNGGALRVLCFLCDLWVKMGYQVIALTDTPGTENDHELPASVKRILIPGKGTVDRAAYADRASALRQIIRENSIDAVVYHAWTLNLMLWDELTIKNAGAAFVAYCHNIFSLECLLGHERFQNTAAPCCLADAVIALSETDRYFWKHINANVFRTVNPFTDGVEGWPVSACDNHDIVWVGRIAKEKQPFEALSIMERVLREVPDARLHVVGDGVSEGFVRRFRDSIAEKGLQDSVILHGFQKDVKPYYEQASIFLSTSEYEGFPLTWQESLLSGLSIVAYELPYLTVAQDNPAVISVKQKGALEAAREIIDLLRNDEKRRQTGKAARAFAEKLLAFDFVGLWRGVFASLTDGEKAMIPDAERIMLQTFILHRDDGMEKVKTKMKNEKLEWEKTIEGLTAEETMMKEQIRKLTAKEKKMRKNHEALAAEMEELREKIAALTEDNEKKKEKIAALTAERTTLEEKAETLKAQGAEMKGKLEALSRKNKKLKKENEAIKRSVSYRIGRIATLPVRITKKGVKKLTGK